MFDILAADIVIFQETKIQRKDLTDDMVLVPGWDCYFSLPKHKKGYSGVVIYTRQAVCSPIRAEEGIAGVLCPPNSSMGYRDGPDDQQIGGYPSEAQLSKSVVDAVTLDSEGRCVILEFPAFVLMGVYSPANRDETRDDFRLGFLDVLDARIRNLAALGKRVVLTGDLNISREEIDTANAETAMRKQGLTGFEYASTPARRLFNHLLEGGKVFGARDQGRENSILWDTCRAFHPDRRGMFTCWEQKVNARPANCGARIDYVLCSLEMKTWVADANIQEGLMGSDHCPVYALLNDKIELQGEERNILDVMNLPGMFLNGERQREYSVTTDPLPMSGRLIPEFFGRRNIRDMFARKPSMPVPKAADIKQSSLPPPSAKDVENENTPFEYPEQAQKPATVVPQSSPIVSSKKRANPNTSVQNNRSLKRTKSNVTPQSPPAPSKGQKSLTGFFKPKEPAVDLSDIKAPPVDNATSDSALATPTSTSPSFHTDPSPSDSLTVKEGSEPPRVTDEAPDLTTEISASQKLTNIESPSPSKENGTVHDPVESKESWSKLFSKPVVPRCEGHNEPCVSLLTKKPGMNLGRSFWMCPRPLGPSGAKETNTQWRCHTFIWCSDWNSRTGD